MLDSIVARGFCLLVLTASFSFSNAKTLNLEEVSRVSLLDYMTANIQDTANQDSIPKYNRLKQFGGWVHQDASNNCYDTRENVLARDEDMSVPLKYSKTGCTIRSGLWHDPYTGTDFTEAAQLQIDHVVPLKAAYYSGAYKWAPALRCSFANYLGNDFHLASVSGHENMSKGDRGPDGYLPPNHNNRCTYISHWMKIKTIWQLTTTIAEVNAIKDVIAQEHCDASLLNMERSELSNQRAKAETPIAECADFGTSAAVASLAPNDKE